ncbi:MAG: cytochrome-c peroxidase [Planctomycetaceae bacterium]
MSFSVCVRNGMMVTLIALAPSLTVAGETVLLGSDDLTTGIPGKGSLTTAEIKTWLASPANHETLDATLPLGLSAASNQIVGLDENPLTRAKIELGRQLYFDTRLSADDSVSCASCHHPDEGFARHTQFGVGINQQEGGRNSPVSYNRILSSLQFWDGRAGSLEEQAIGPIANPIEMGNTHDACVDSLKGIEGYVLQFEKIFGKDGVTIENVGKAIAAFERVLVTGPSPYDHSEAYARYSKLDPEDLKDLIEADDDLKAQYESAKANAAAHPMLESARRGQELFFGDRVNCAACHVGANLADEKYHNLGVGMDAKEPDVGRFEVTKNEKDWGAFKTPTIRNVALSAPYMHDGAQKTLMEVVEHYDKGGIPNKNLSDKMRKLNLTQQERQDLVAFMEACTGKFPKVERERLPK